MQNILRVVKKKHAIGYFDILSSEEVKEFYLFHAKFVAIKVILVYNEIFFSLQEVEFLATVDLLPSI